MQNFIINGIFFQDTEYIRHLNMIYYCTIIIYLLMIKIFIKARHMKKIGRLHVITDTTLQNRFSHLELTAMAISGGADTIQFRQKSGSTREMIDVARQMKRLCLEAGVTFIVNDRIDIAIAADSDGIHLGQDDFPVPMARELLGTGKLIGGSAGNRKEARKCFHEGVDYIGFGPVYSTTSKDDAGPVCGNDIMKHLSEEISLPFIAIGGVDVEKVPDVIGAGAYGIAVISSVCCQEDPEYATRMLREALYK
jgi:thiamine-phosphate pyrophosphorylase